MSNVTEFPRPSLAPPPASARHALSASDAGGVPLNTQLRESLEQEPLSLRLLSIDRQVGHLPASTTYPQISREQAENLVDRAATAIRSGNPLRRAVAIEKAFQRLLKVHHAAVNSGKVPQSSSLSHLEVEHLRALAKAAYQGGADYMAGKAGE